MSMLLLFSLHLAAAQLGTLLDRFPGSCRPGQFDCGDECISLAKFHDCVVDCTLGYDEDCWPGMVKCDQCRCVDVEDADRLCLDRSTSCPSKICNMTSKAVFQCTRNKCICVIDEWRFDGSNDCGDWSDENECLREPSPCGSNETCTFIIPNFFRCDPIESTPGPPTTTAPQTTVPPIVIPTSPCALSKTLNATGKEIDIAFLLDGDRSMRPVNNFIADSLGPSFFRVLRNEAGRINRWYLTIVYDYGRTRESSTSPPKFLTDIQQARMDGNTTNCERKRILFSLRQGVSSARSGSIICVFTSGSDPDLSEKQLLIEEAQAKNLQIYFVLVDFCGNSESRTAYEEIARATNGEAFFVTKTRDTISMIMTYLGSMAETNREAVYDGAANSLVVNAGESMGDMFISVRGENISLNVDVGTDLVRQSEMIASPWVAMHHIEQYANGDVEATVASTGSHRMKITVRQAPSVSFLFTPAPMQNPEFTYPDFVFGVPMMIIATLSDCENCALTSATVQALDGSPLKTVEMNRMSTGTRKFASDFIFVDFCGAANIAVSGSGDCDEEFTRISKTPIRIKDLYNGVPSSNCSGGFDCGERCIPASEVNNGIATCRNGLDEAKKPSPLACGTPDKPDWKCTKPKMLLCENGNCVDLSKIGDGVDDCGDKTDETGINLCPNPGMLLCQNGKCVNFSLINNGVDDCGDGTDEGNGNTCPAPGMLLCENGQCVPLGKINNGADDCGDGTDESVANPCPPGTLQCRNGNCVSLDKVGDTVNDCGDGTDEEVGTIKCPTPGMFMCANKECIDASLIDNGVKDCKDGSDENKNTSCPNTNMFLCANSNCVGTDKISNGVDDCGDGSDEISNKACPEYGMLQCRNGNCVALDVIDNGVDDCGDNTDENIKEPACDRDMFTCGNGNCLSVDLINNGNDDCGDGSDETGGITCPGNGMLVCVNGNCVGLEKVGDGVDDCGDGTDETLVKSGTTPAPTVPTTTATSYLSTPLPPPVTVDFFERLFNNTCGVTGYFQCTDGSCIHFSQFRDCSYNCLDGSDEVCYNGLSSCNALSGNMSYCKCSDPTSNTCEDEDVKSICATKGFYPCQDGRMCLPKDWFLNGIRECPDGSDEDEAYLDECYLGLAKCSKNALCLNIEDGGYECICKYAYKGDGFTCIDPTLEYRV